MEDIKTMATKKKAPKKKAAKKAPKPTEAKVEAPESVEVLIIGNFPNAMWLKGVDKNGKQYKIRVPKRFSNRLLHKQIKITHIDGELEEYYKWEP